MYSGDPNPGSTLKIVWEIKIFKKKKTLAIFDEHELFPHMHF